MIGLAKVVIVTVSLASLLSGGALVALTGGPGPGSGSDYGLDTDGDGAFDWLVVKMDLSVERPNWYNMWATLGTDKPFGRGCGFGGPVPLGGPYMGRDGLTILPEESAYPISWASVRQFFEAGDHQVSLAFKGTEISYAGVDGPYTVQAQAYADGEWDGRIMDPSFGAPMPGPSRWDWTYVTGSYHADAFEQPRFAIQFTGTPDDAGLDLDADGLYDYLVISTEADVALGGMYSIGGSLYVGQDPRTTVWVAGTWGFVELREGRQTIEYRFNGADVWASGQAGSFHFTLDAYYGGGVWWGNGTGIREGEPYPGPTGDFDFYGDNACGTTSEYRHEQFEERVEPAKYTGVFRDYGEDYDGDGQFEALAVEAEVEVTEANVFDFSGQLASQDGFTWFSGAYQQMYLDVGVHMLALRFPGPDIRRNLGSLVLFIRLFHWLGSWPGAVLNAGSPSIVAEGPCLLCDAAQPWETAGRRRHSGSHAQAPVTSGVRSHACGAGPSASGHCGSLASRISSCARQAVLGKLHRLQGVPYAQSKVPLERLRDTQGL